MTLLQGYLICNKVPYIATNTTDEQTKLQSKLKDEYECDETAADTNDKQPQKIGEIKLRSGMQRRQ